MSYLDKYSFIPPQIADDPHPELNIIIVIPCFNEPDLIRTLNSLFLCDRPENPAEVIIVINSGEHHSDKIKSDNLFTLKEAEHWVKRHSSPEFKFHFIHVPELPAKHAGVGLARKIGMDEAVHRFELIDHNGVIVCFDADSQCEKNYLVEIERHFKQFNRSPGCSIHFEHPLAGDEYDPEVYKGIIQYELHLRYYKQALQYCRLPYAYHTVGSSMAVTSLAYQMQGGMNRRKAGEDFYFIHKIIALGGFTELKETKVIPSPRVSDRVPFGTGKAIGDWVRSESHHLETYNFKSFQLIKSFVELIPDLYDHQIEKMEFWHDDQNFSELKIFLIENNIEKVLEEIKKNTTDRDAFIKRFFTWFDAFKILKLTHYLRDHLYSNQPVLSAVNDLYKEIEKNEFEAEVKALEYLRKIDRS